jgi:hypothetical protein
MDATTLIATSGSVPRKESTGHLSTIPQEGQRSQRSLARESQRTKIPSKILNFKFSNFQQFQFKKNPLTMDMSGF